MSLSNLTQTTPDEIRVTIMIDASAPGGKTLTRTPDERMYFRHNQGEATDPNRRHGIHWVVENLNAGEMIEIQLDTSFPGYVERPVPFQHRSWFDHLKMIFPTAIVLPSGALGWLLTPGKTEDHTGSAKVLDRFNIRSREPENKPVIRYNVVLIDANGQEHALDPGVEVEPDP